jgi:hypothetical protein
MDNHGYLPCTFILYVSSLFLDFKALITMLDETLTCNFVVQCCVGRLGLDMQIHRFHQLLHHYRSLISH